QVEKIRNCKANEPACERAQVALNLFLSTAFYERGSFILRSYEAGRGQPPSYEEFMDAMRRFNELSFHARVESDEMIREFGNRAFVMLHYYGYLRRAPDPASVAGWLELLNRSGDATRITEGFINSPEYRHRFRN